MCSAILLFAKKTLEDITLVRELLQIEAEDHTHYLSGNDKKLFWAMLKKGQSNKGQSDTEIGAEIERLVGICDKIEQVAG